MNRQRRCIWTIRGSGGDAVEPHDCPSVAAFVKELTRYGSGDSEESLRRLRTDQETLVPKAPLGLHNVLSRDHKKYMALGP